MSDVTQILSRIDAGDPVAAEQLLPLVYDELKKLAAARLVQEKPGQTLQATALVHEAYLRLVGPTGNGPMWNGRGHFFAAAAEAMRRILVENARHKKSMKGGGAMQRVDYECFPANLDCDSDQLLDLNEALTKLEHDDPDAAMLARLRLFSGLAIDEAASQLGIHRATAFRRWAYARVFLQLQLAASPVE